MRSNSNLSPLPWYESLDQQYGHKWYAQKDCFKLITDQRNILPFQIIRRSRVDKNTLEFTLVCLGDNTERDFTNEMIATGLRIVPMDSYDVIISPNTNILTDTLQRGYYYATLSDGYETWYSEVFYVVENIDKYIKLEYWSDTPQPIDSLNGCSFLYGSNYNYINVLYIDSTLGRPEYPFEEEGSERDGLPFIEKQISRKIYKFIAMMPEYFMDAVRMAWLAEHKYMTADGITYDLFSFLPTENWQPNGNVTMTECECGTDNIVKSIARGVVDPLNGIVIFGKVLNILTGFGVPNLEVDLSLDPNGNRTLIGRTATSGIGKYSHRWLVSQTQYAIWLLQQLSSEPTGVQGGYSSLNSALKLPGSFSIVCLFTMPETLGRIQSDQYLIFRGAQIGNFRISVVRENNQVVARFEFADIIRTTPLSAGQNVSMGVSYNSATNTATFYFDGQKMTQITPYRVATPDIFVIGSAAPGTEIFTGQIKAVHYMNYINSDAEMIRMLNGGLPSRATTGSYLPRTVTGSQWLDSAGKSSSTLNRITSYSELFRQGILLAQTVDETQYYPAYTRVELPSYQEALKYGIEANINVIKKDELILNPDTIYAESEGADYWIDIDSPLYISDITSSSSWVTAIIEDGRIKVSVDDNFGFTERNATIYLHIGSSIIPVPVIQESATATIDVTPRTLLFSSDGSPQRSFSSADFNMDFNILASNTLTVTAQSNWEVKRKPEWVTVTPSTGAAGETTVNVSVTAGGQATDTILFGIVGQETAVEVTITRQSVERLQGFTPNIDGNTWGGFIQKNVSGNTTYERTLVFDINIRWDVPAGAAGYIYTLNGIPSGGQNRIMFQRNNAGGFYASIFGQQVVIIRNNELPGQRFRVILKLNPKVSGEMSSGIIKVKDKVIPFTINITDDFDVTQQLRIGDYYSNARWSPRDRVLGYKEFHRVLNDSEDNILLSEFESFIDKTAVADPFIELIPENLLINQIEGEYYSFMSPMDNTKWDVIGSSGVTGNPPLVDGGLQIDLSDGTGYNGYIRSIYKQASTVTGKYVRIKFMARGTMDNLSINCGLIPNKSGYVQKDITLEWQEYSQIFFDNGSQPYTTIAFLPLNNTAQDGFALIKDVEIIYESEGEWLDDSGNGKDFTQVGFPTPLIQ